jgi:hypothetical protein
MKGMRALGLVCGTHSLSRATGVLRQKPVCGVGPRVTRRNSGRNVVVVPSVMDHPSRRRFHDGYYRVRAAFRMWNAMMEHAQDVYDGPVNLLGRDGQVGSA